MNTGIQRALLRLLVTLGIVLCLSPFVAQMRLTWGMVMQPTFATINQKGPPNKEQLDKINDPTRIQKAYASDPWLLGTTFVVAPVGLGLIAVGMKRLRLLRRPPGGPVWPANYRPGAVP